jgi:tetratricopeptide (TPR) repeat protein
MGIVLRVIDTDLQRPLAVKVMLERGGSASEERFLEEARITGQLQHPGIAPVHEIGRLADGRPFFAMKLIEGRTLADLLRDRWCATGSASAGPADLPRFLKIFEQIAQTLAYAHSQGVIHRDLKPSNIMVGAFGEVQVMDWGLAHRLQSSAERRIRGAECGANAAPRISTPHSELRIPNSDDRLTQAGQVLGTPAYMPPEQAQGQIDELDERADVFGLGAILCVILTGHPPYQGRSTAEFHRHAQEADLGDALACLDACGADAEIIVLAKECLAPRPGGRPRDASVVADRVNAYLASVQERLKEAEIAHAAAQAKAAEERKRRRVTVALAICAMLLVFGATAVAAWIHQQRVKADAHRQQTDGELETTLSEAAATLERVKGQLADEFKYRELLDQSSRWEELLDLVRSRLERADDLWAGAPKGVSQTWPNRVGELRSALKSADQARQFAQRLESIRDEAFALSEGKWDAAGIAERYVAAFAEEGFDVEQEDIATLAQGVRSSPIHWALVAAIDYWAATLAFTNESPEALLRWARESDPDAWRDRFREPTVWRDRAALARLAAEPEALRQSPQFIEALALRLNNTGGDASALLQAALLRYPRDFWLHFRLASNVTDPRERADCFRAALEIRPEAAVGHNNLGIALAAQGKLDEAVACYHKALELDYKNALAHNNLGNALKSQGKLDQAINHYHVALALEPNYANAHCNLGTALQAQRKLDDAIACQQKALKLNPKHANAHINLGAVLFDQGKLDEAVIYYRKALKLDPKNPYIHNSLGNVLLKLKKHEEALACYREAAEADPKYGTAHFNLGIALREQRKPNEAVACFRKVLQLNPKHPNAHFQLGNALFDLRQLEESIACFRAAVQLSPKNAAVHNNLGNVLREQGKLEEAITCLRRAIELDPELAFAHNNLGKALQAQGKLAEAIACFRRAIELDPEYATAHNNLDAALRQRGKQDDLVERFRKAVQLNPKNARAHYDLGTALRDQGEVEQAIACYRQALELDPKYAMAHNSLGSALYSQGKLKESIACIRTALELDPTLAIAHYNLGVGLYRERKLDQAIVSYRTALELNPKLVRAYRNLGLALKDKGRFDEALPIFQRAIELQPDHAESHCDLGLALQHEGEFAQALAALKRGHELGSARKDWRQPSARWVKVCERMMELDSRLPRVLKGESRPADAAERLEYALLCYYRKLYVAATRFCSEAFAAEPKLAENLPARHRYNAACTAALAGCGQDKDDPTSKARLDDKDRARLRRQSFDWLRADLAGYERLLTAAKPQDLRLIEQSLQSWQHDPDLAGVRDEASLKNLPSDEQSAWRQLWTDAAALRQKADAASAKPIPQAASSNGKQERQP